MLLLSVLSFSVLASTGVSVVANGTSVESSGASVVLSCGSIASDVTSVITNPDFDAGCFVDGALVVFEESAVDGARVNASGAGTGSG